MTMRGSGIFFFQCSDDGVRHRPERDMSIDDPRVRPDTGLCNHELVVLIDVDALAVHAFSLALAGCSYPPLILIAERRAFEKLAYLHGWSARFRRACDPTGGQHACAVVLAIVEHQQTETSVVAKAR